MVVHRHIQIGFGRTHGAGLAGCRPFWGNTTLRTNMARALHTPQTRSNGQRTEWLHSFCQARPINVWVTIAAMDQKSCDEFFVDLSILDERFAVLRSGEAQGGYSL